MENWGLITYRETNLLYDENQSSSYNKQRVASVIAHELVHQVQLSTHLYPGYFHDLANILIILKFFMHPVTESEIWITTLLILFV